MTITTRVQLHCDVGLKCTKQIASTVVGPQAGQTVRAWAKAQGWGTWGDRDACPDCWKELHSATEAVDMALSGATTEGLGTVGRVQAELDEEELQRAIDLRRGVIERDINNLRKER